MAATTSTHIGDLPAALNSLIALKTSRDNFTFTPYKLAKAVNVDRSLIQRLLNGEVENPRIDTLMKIAQFFINDGFAITIDDLLHWKTKAIDVQEQVLVDDEPKNLALYQMSTFSDGRVGTISIRAPKSSPGTIAILSAQNIPPIFNAGSVFVVDMLKKPQHENLVIIRLANNKNISLRKYIVANNKKITLQSFDLKEVDLKISATTEECKIIGVVIFINVKA